MAIPTLHRIVASAAFGFAATLSLGATSAKALIVGASDIGWYRDDGSHIPTNTNYFTGMNYVIQLRSFFYFDLTGVTPAGQQIESADLYAYTFVVSSNNQLVTLFDYVGDQASLLAGTGGIGAYDDLGTGTSYGSMVFNSADSNSYKAYTLNSAAISALNASSPGTFVIGARNSTNVAEEYVYGFSNTGTPSTNVYLNLKFTPGPIPLLGAAATFGFSRKLRRRIHASGSAGVRTSL